MKTVLTIAGSDCSGGAGIQADLKTIGAFGLYGMSVITALTIQNTKGVYRVEAVQPATVREQIQAVFDDIKPDVVKIGMVVNRENIREIVLMMQKYQPVIVLDPVMIATSGRVLLDGQAVDMLMEELFPLVTLLTPNLPEAEFLTGKPVNSHSEREESARILAEKYDCSVLVKGGHGVENADDLLYDKGECIWYKNKRIENENTHGTGCTLSSAIACGIASGLSLPESVREAKDYITGAIEDGMNLGEGNGPLNHFYHNKKEGINQWR